MDLKILGKKRMLFAIAAFTVSAGAYPSSYQVMLAMDVKDTVSSAGANLAPNVANAVSNFGVNAVLLRIAWRDVEPTTQGTFQWTDLDSALYNIAQGQNLNLSVRINFSGTSMPPWTNSGGILKDSNYMQIQNATLFKKQGTYNGAPYTSHILSFASPLARATMAKSLDSIVNHIASKLNALGKSGNLLDVTPTLAFSDETTYPADDELGVDSAVDYSPAAINGFRAFLGSKYGSISVLNSQWSAWTPGGIQTASFSSFSDIDPRATSAGGKGWNWHLAPGKAPISSNIFNYNYYVGRRDWYEYRQSSLKVLIDQLAAVVHSHILTGGTPVRFGIEPGGITPNWNNQVSPMERQGWYDFTPLAENVDWIHVASNTEYGQDLWNIEADYLRSVCKFWAAQKSADVRFSDESNWAIWPDSSTYSDTITYSRKFKSDADSLQLLTFRNKGAGGHVIFGWGLENAFPRSTSYYRNPITLDTVFRDFSSLTNLTKQVAGASRVSVSNTNAVHVSTSRVATDMGRFFPGLSYSINHTTHTVNYTPLASISPNEILPNDGTHTYGYNFYNTSNCDFLTDYMILQGGGLYVNTYDNIYLPNGSYHIYNDPFNGLVYDALLSSSVYSNVVNGTIYATGLGYPSNRFHIIPGSQPFAGSNSPEVLRMIWRSSNPLSPLLNRWQSIWPDGRNLTTDTAVLHANGLPSNWLDFVQFVVQNDDSSADMFQNVSINYGNWDMDAITMWSSSPDTGFVSWAHSMWPDGYNCASCAENTSSRTYLDWIVEDAAPADLGTWGKWSTWPYGDPPELSKASARKKTILAAPPYFEVSQAGKQISFALKNREQQAFSVELYDIHGRVLFRSKAMASRAPIDLSRFSSGVYFYNVSAGKDLTKKGKFAFH